MNAVSCAGSCGGYSSSSSSYYDYSSGDEAATATAAAAPAAAAAAGQKTPTTKGKLEGEIPRKLERRRRNPATTISGQSHTLSGQSVALSPTILNRQKRKNKPAKITRRDPANAIIRKPEPARGNPVEACNPAEVRKPKPAQVRKPEAAEFQKPENERDSMMDKNRRPKGFRREIRVTVNLGFDDGADKSGADKSGADKSGADKSGADKYGADGDAVNTSALTRANYTQSARPRGNEQSMGERNVDEAVHKDDGDDIVGEGERTNGADATEKQVKESSNLRKFLGGNLSFARRRISVLKRSSFQSKTPSGQKQLEARFLELRSEFEERWRDLEGGVEKSKWRKDLVARIDDFSFLKSLGNGAFGNVYLVRHKDTDVIHAMKVLEKALIMDVKMVFHALEEKRILAAIDFPFLVKTKYFFHDNANIYFAMNFIPGGEMYPYYKAMNYLPEEQTKFFAAQIVLAFEYLQSVDILYRDLKPENVLIGADGYIVLVDMGFAKKKVPGQLCYTMCGTPEYLAPEIILGEGYDEGVDWWSLGVMIFELSKGETPFAAMPPIRMYQKIITNQLTLPTHFSPPLRDLIARLLARNSSKRIGNNESKGRAKEVKCQAWFSGIDFFEIYSKKMKPPYIPPVKGGTDVSFFGDKAAHFRMPLLKTDPFREYFIDF